MGTALVQQTGELTSTHTCRTRQFDSLYHPLLNSVPDKEVGFYTKNIMRPHFESIGNWKNMSWGQRRNKCLFRQRRCLYFISNPAWDGCLQAELKHDTLFKSTLERKKVRKGVFSANVANCSLFHRVKKWRVCVCVCLCWIIVDSHTNVLQCVKENALHSSGITSRRQRQKKKKKGF